MNYNALSYDDLTTLAQDLDVKALKEVAKRYEYGPNYESGKILVQDLNKAEKLYHIAGELSGNDFFELAYKFLYGINFEQNAKKAIDLFIECGDKLQGNEICAFLAKANLLGLYKTPDDGKCHSLLVDLNQNYHGDKDFHLELAKTYFSGIGCKPDGFLAYKNLYLGYCYLLDKFKNHMLKFNLKNPKLVNLLENIKDLSSQILDIIKTKAPRLHTAKENKIILANIEECLLFDHSSTFYKLGFAYEYGLGVKQNIKTALNFYKDAFSKSSILSGIRLIEYYEDEKISLKYYKSLFHHIIWRMTQAINMGYGLNIREEAPIDDLIELNNKL